MTTEVGDVTVGLFGLVTNGFHSITDYPEDYEVIDNVEAAQEATAALREEGADLVICPAHISSGRMETVAEAVDDLDAIIGSHSGYVDEAPSVVNGTLISEFGDEFEHLARLEIDGASGELLDWERADFVDPEVEDDPEAYLPAIEDEENQTVVDVNDLEGDGELRELVDQYLDDLDERLGQPIVETEVELNATFDNYAIETGWGNLMLDIMRDVGDFDEEIDVATQNAGGIRSNATYGPGEITGRDVNNILPFPNEIEVYELEGEYLYEYLENQVRWMPDPQFGAQPAIQVSGVSYEWWGHDGEARINNVLVGGEPIDMDETYLVSTNDFEAGRTVIGEQGELVLESGQFQGAFTMDRLEADYEVVAPEREHRMIRVDEWVDTIAMDYDDGDLAVTVENTDASEGIVDGTFRLLAPNGDTVDAAAVEADDESITAMFEAEYVEALVDEDDPEPQLRLLGGFDPDDEHYGYEDEGEIVELPPSSGYEYHKLQSEPDLSAVLDLLQDEDDPDEDDDADADDADDAGTDDDTGTDDSDDTGTTDGDDDTGTDDGDDPETEDDTDDADDSDDDGPGFGPFAAIAGAGGAAYLLSERVGSDEMDDEA